MAPYTAGSGGSGTSSTSNESKQDALGAPGASDAPPTAEELVRVASLASARHHEEEEILAAADRLSHYHSTRADGRGHFHKPGRQLGARFGRVFVAGAGFLADAYDIFVINIALMMMKQVDYGVPLTHDTQRWVSLMTILGALTGQILFGVLGDQFGRKWTFISTAVLTVFGTILQAAAQPQMMGLNIWQQLMLFRFLMGVGIGGEYPMASTVTSEGSRPEDRGRNLAAVFSMQGVGRVLCAIVLLFSAYCITDPNWQWRFSILFGAVPMLACLRFRWLPESEVFEEDVGKTPPMERLINIAQAVYSERKKLLGTAGSWFILDVVFYGNSLFSADVTSAMGTKPTLRSNTLTNLWIQLMAMPGYICAVIFLDRVGRKRLQLIGFAGEAVIFAIMAIFYSRLKNIEALFIILYAATFYFDDFGPNTTTFICHGISAAFGKAGAAIGGYLFVLISDMYCTGGECTKSSPRAEVDKGIRTVFICCSALAVGGFAWTWALVDDTPHASLAKAENMELLEPEKPGEVAALEGKVVHGIELGVLKVPEGYAVPPNEPVARALKVQ